MLQFLGEARRGQKMLYVGLYLHIKIPSNLDPLVTFFTLLKIKYIITTKQKKGPRSYFRSMRRYIRVTRFKGTQLSQNEAHYTTRHLCFLSRSANLPEFFPSEPNSLMKTVKINIYSLILSATLR